jgi:DNA polymerase I-like protein with 3'-5' exonuclease and polymerase domains
LSSALRAEVEQAGLSKLYEEIDLPLAPVLARMEQAGVKIDTAALAQMSSELEREIAAKAGEIYQAAGMEFNVASPKQLADVLFNRMNLPKPAKVELYRQRSMYWKNWPRIIPSRAWCSTIASSPSSNRLTSTPCPR